MVPPPGGNVQEISRFQNAFQPKGSLFEKQGVFVAVLLDHVHVTAIEDLRVDGTRVGLLSIVASIVPTADTATATGVCVVWRVLFFYACEWLCVVMCARDLF